MEKKPREQNEKETPEGKTSNPINYFVIVEVGIEFAVIIALPLTAFVFLGKWLDAKYGTNFIVIIGILLALTLSSLAIGKKISDIKKSLK